MFLPLLAALAVVLTAAKLGGWLSGRLGQPVVLGELLAGLLLGPSVLNVLGWPYFAEAHVGAALREFGELGVIFLMFSAGLEIQPQDLAHAGRPAVLAGVLGVAAPILLGLAVLVPFGYDVTQALFLGVVMAATSVSISAQTLLELGHLRSRAGLTLLGAAVVDDVLALGVLAVFLAVALGQGGGPLMLLWIFVRMLLFLAGAFLLGSWLLPRAVHWVEIRRLPVAEPVLSLVIIAILGLAWMAEVGGGVAAITGAFIAGVALAGSPSKEKIERGIRSIAFAFFVPVFLVSLGLQAEARALTAGEYGLVAVICVVAVGSKVIGAGGGARLGGLTGPEALRVGVGMISRGEVGLIVASVGVNAGVLDAAGFTAVVLMVLVTTLAAPPLLRWVLPREESKHA